WFRIPSLPSNDDRILQRGNDGTGGWSVQISVNSTGRLSAGIESPGIYITGTTVLTPNTWYQATFVFENNNSIRLYLNDTLEASNTIGNVTLRNSDNRLRIGTGNIASEYFNGDIDDVRVWNAALSQTDIQDAMNCELDGSQNNVVAYYKFNQGFDAANNAAITTATDSSGNGNNGTLTNFALTGITSNWQSGSAITTGNTCSLVLSNSNFETNKLNIYPNPSNGIFTINSEEVLDIKVYDLIGKLIYSNKVNSGINQIDISNYSNGIYLLQYSTTSGKTNSMKLIKN